MMMMMMMMMMSIVDDDDDDDDDDGEKQDDGYGSGLVYRKQRPENESHARQGKPNPTSCDNLLQPLSNWWQQSA